MKDIARFWSKVAVGSHSDCWEWQAGHGGGGYGQIKIKGVMLKAHRFSWELANGPIPDGLCVCHHCDNRRCVNPSHLFLGTLADNNADRDAKGRRPAPCGQTNGRAKLQSWQVPYVLCLASSGVAQIDIARAYGLSRSAMNALVNGGTWRQDFDRIFG